MIRMLRTNISSDDNHHEDKDEYKPFPCASPLEKGRRISGRIWGPLLIKRLAKLCDKPSSQIPPQDGTQCIFEATANYWPHIAAPACLQKLQVKALCLRLCTSNVHIKETPDLFYRYTYWFSLEFGAVRKIHSLVLLLLSSNCCALF